MGRGKELPLGTKEAIVDMAKSGSSSYEIARILGLNCRSVRRIIAKHERSGSVENKPHTGRPRKTDERYDRRLVILSKSDRHKTARKLNSEMSEETGVNLSDRSVRRRLLDNGLQGCIAKKKPFISEKKNRRARLSFAKDHKDWSMDDWCKVLWSDESKFNMRASDGARYVRRMEGESLSTRCLRGTVKHGGGGHIMVWGCMTASGVGRIFNIQGTMKTDQYLGILANIMRPSMVDLFGDRPAVFQHDNDPKHTAKATKAWLAANNIDVLQWPAQSPDLNPIENLWEILQHHRQSNQRPKNKEELWQECQAAWNRISADTCRKLVESMPKRIQAVIENEGGNTKY